MKKLFILIYFTAMTMAKHNRNTSVLTIGYLVTWERNLLIGTASGSAFVIGLEEVKRRQILPGYEIKWLLRDTYCNPQQGMNLMFFLVSGSFGTYRGRI